MYLCFNVWISPSVWAQTSLHLVWFYSFSDDRCHQLLQSLSTSRLTWYPLKEKRLVPLFKSHPWLGLLDPVIPGSDLLIRGAMDPWQCIESWIFLLAEFLFCCRQSSSYRLNCGFFVPLTLLIQTPVRLIYFHAVEVQNIQFYKNIVTATFASPWSNWTPFLK